MTIVGRGGVGKTAMVCRLLKALEAGELPDGLGAMNVEGIVYLSERGSHRVNFANVQCVIARRMLVHNPSDQMRHCTVNHWHIVFANERHH